MNPMDLINLAIEHPKEALIVILMMGMAVALLALYNFYKNIKLAKKYEKLNTLLARVCDGLYAVTGTRLIKQHREGDYEQSNPLFDGDKRAEYKPDVKEGK